MSAIPSCANGSGLAPVKARALGASVAAGAWVTAGAWVAVIGKNTDFGWNDEVLTVTAPDCGPAAAGAGAETTGGAGAAGTNTAVATGAGVGIGAGFGTGAGIGNGTAVGTAGEGAHTSVTRATKAGSSALVRAGTDESVATMWTA